MRRGQNGFTERRRKKHSAATGENDNIINYKSNVTNRYSSWEQDLTEREKKVRQAEKELGIEDTSEYYDESTGTE